MTEADAAQKLRNLDSRYCELLEATESVQALGATGVLDTVRRGIKQRYDEMECEFESLRAESPSLFAKIKLKSRDACKALLAPRVQ